MKKQLSLFFLLLIAVGTMAQRPNYNKMSSFIRELTVQHRVSANRVKGANFKSPVVCAFIRINQDAEAVLEEYGCQKLAQFGDIYIANIPLSSMPALSLNKNVQRIEANRVRSVKNDSIARAINALPAYEGKNMPQAYTGKGTVVGIMDIGFDLTNPTFYDATATNYRIKRFWDQLARNGNATLPVGKDFRTEEDIKNCERSYDGLEFSHGTHTLGTAAGSGYDTPYRGVAYESDMCVVNNATGNNAHLIADEDYNKFTTATDVLGFKYIFDYAKEMEQPCVISFSEGSSETFEEEERLFYEVLDQMVGPGRILVASAGNNASDYSYFKKPAGAEKAGLVLFTMTGTPCSFTLKSAQPFQLKFLMYGQDPDTWENTDLLDSHTITTTEVCALPDSIYSYEKRMVNGSGESQFEFTVHAYRSCYNASEYVYDVVIKSSGSIGLWENAYFEVIGDEAEIEFFARSGFFGNGDEEHLKYAENSHTINSPSAAPRVISVGATAHRTQFVNKSGELMDDDNYGEGGERADFSSTGPTLDGRIKPDVMAPGTHIISAFSHFYLNSQNGQDEAMNTVQTSTFNGREYGWNADSGTSMATPAVAGAIALWLQANPTLSPEDIVGIFSRTCTQTKSDLSYPNNYYGYGQIDVYRGLLDILQLSRIEELSLKHTSAKLEVSNKQLVVNLKEPSSRKIAVRIYSVGGALVHHETLPAGKLEYRIDLSRLPGAVYAVQLTGDREMTGSSLIRL